MLIKELKEYIKNLPDDADIVMQKRLADKQVVIAPVLSLRTAKIKHGTKERLVLMNLKSPKII